ncbi:MAG: flagellar protein FlaG [Formivibrio sp.]|nr:flagellar protein FlaG [Formivibrio sp.]
MDMSVKLNLSYPAVAPANTVVDQPAEPQVEGISTSTSTSTGAETGSSGKDADAEKLKAAVQEIEKYVQSIKRNLEFSIDETSGRVVVKVIATATGEVVRQIPTEEVLKLADNLSTAGSVLFNRKA